MNKYYRFAILGKKLGMTQVFDENGMVVPVTAIEVGPCPVIQKKTKESDGYDAIQIGFEDVKKQNVKKPQAGHFALSKAPVKRFLREVRLDEKTINDYQVGQVLDASLFNVGDQVDVTGKSIGKGFQGVIRRHGFATPDYTHNAEFFRHGGSIGCREWPGKVWKGKKMGGHMGQDRVTTLNLKVLGVEADKNVILVKGAVPGSKNSLVTVRGSVKGKFAPRTFKKAEAEAPAAQ